MSRPDPGDHGLPLHGGPAGDRALRGVSHPGGRLDVPAAPRDEAGAGGEGEDGERPGERREVKRSEGYTYNIDRYNIYTIYNNTHIDVPVASFARAGVPPHGMGRKAEARACLMLATKVTSTHHKDALHGRSGDHARDLTQRTHHASYITYHRKFRILETSYTQHHGAVLQLHASYMKHGGLHGDSTEHRACCRLDDT